MGTIKGDTRSLDDGSYKLRGSSPGFGVWGLVF